MSASNSLFNFSAILDEGALRDYLSGIINTILFLRLLGTVEPCRTQNSFMGICYPVILESSTADTNNSPSTSPQSWTREKIAAIVNSYTEKKKGQLDQNTSQFRLSHVFTKIIFILKLYDTHSGNEGICWETWVIETDVLNPEAFHGTDVSLIEKSQKADPFVANNRPLYDFLNMAPYTRSQFIKDTFRSNMLDVIKHADSNRGVISNSSMNVKTLDLFPIKSDYLIDFNLYNTNFNIGDLTKNSDLEFISNSFNLSSLSQESLQQITASDFIDDSSATNQDDPTQQNNIPKRSDDLWKNGYNFFKKILE